MVSEVVRVMLHTGDLAPAARDMGTEALRQWATLHGADDTDAMYVVGVAVARGMIVEDEDDDGDVLRSAQWAAREVAASLYGVNAWDADASVDAFEGGYLDERNGTWDDQPTMADVLGAVQDMRDAACDVHACEVCGYTPLAGRTVTAHLADDHHEVTSSNVFDQS